MPTWHLMALPYVAVALLSIWVMISAWLRRRRTPASRALALCMLGVMTWSGADAAMALTPPRYWTAIALVIFCGSGCITTGFYLVARIVVDESWRASRGTATVLIGLSVAAVLVAATEPWHHLVLARAPVPTPWGVPAINYGPAFWVYLVAGYATLPPAFAVLVRTWLRGSSLQRRQLSTLMLASLVSLAGDLAYVYAQLHADRPFDFTPIGFAASGVLFLYSLRRQGLFQLLPVARELVMEKLVDGVVVVDLEDRVIDLNPAAWDLVRRRTGRFPAELLGKPSHQLFLDEPGRADGERRWSLSDGVIDVDVRSSPLTDRRGHRLGRAIVIRDIAELTRQREELAAANGRLHNQVALIERLRAEVAEQAARDPLTGLHNRRHLSNVLERELAEALTDGRPVAVALLDVDHFKAVNDTYGHAAGDEVLIAVGNRLAAAARPVDTVARYGGEEFVLVFPGMTVEQAAHRVDAIRLRCAEPLRGAGPASITLSAGVAGYPELGDSPDVLVAAADTALYRAKQAGRNRVLVAELAPS
jgi:diguanylate cyclase (GGDEF)-like protein